MKNFLLALQRFVVGLGCVCTLLLGIFLLFIDRVAAGSACLSASVVLFFLTNIEMFETIKGPGGVEARMRDLTTRVTEMAELTERLKGLVISMAELSATLLSRSGYLADPLPREELLRRMRGVEAQLTAAGISRSETLKIMSDWHSDVALQLLVPAYRAISDCIKERQEHAAKQWHAIKKPIEQADPDYINALAIREADSKGYGDFKTAWSSSDNTGRLALLERVQSYLLSDVSGRPVPDAAAIKESLRHAQHYLATNTFLSEEYWISMGN